jgi:hypothetical protein
MLKWVFWLHKTLIDRLNDVSKNGLVNTVHVNTIRISHLTSHTRRCILTITILHDIDGKSTVDEYM